MSNRPVVHMVSAIHIAAGYYVGDHVSMVYKIYCQIVNCTIFLNLVANAYQICLAPSTQKQFLAVNIITAIGFISALYSALCFQLQFQQILKLKPLLETTMLSVSDITLDKNGKTTFNSDTTNNKITLAKGLTVAFVPAFLFSIQPLLRSMAVLGMDGGRELQIDSWFPFDVKSSGVFEMLIGFEFLAVFWVCLRFFATDAFYETLFRINIQLLISLAGFGKKVISRDNSNYYNGIQSHNTTSQLNQPHQFIHNEFIIGLHDVQFKNEVDEKMRVFMMNHLLILRCAKMTCDLYSPLMLMYLLGMMGFASVGSFGIFHTSGLKGVQPFSVALFSIVNLLGIYFMCSTGDVLTQKSSEVAEHLFYSPWYLCSKKFRSSLLIVLRRTTTRVGASVIGVPSMPLSRSTFLWFLKTLISFYLFLVQVQPQKANNKN